MWNFNKTANVVRKSWDSALLHPSLRAKWLTISGIASGIAFETNTVTLPTLADCKVFQ